MVWKCVLWLILPLSATVKSHYDKSPFNEYSVDVNDQSPVNINSREAEVIHLPPLEFYNLETFKESEVIVKNTGTTVDIEFPEHTLNIPEVSQGPLENIYRFKQMHFHWGSQNEGSEHEINNIRYAMEIHVVFYNTRFESFDEALVSPVGLCVIGMIGKISDHNNTNLNDFINDVQDLTIPNTEIKGHFNALFPWIQDTFFTQDYYTYHGSLTTSPYSESVIWMIMIKTFEISPIQLEEFRHLHTKDKSGVKYIDRNFRTLQNLNGRLIYFTHNMILG